MMTTSVERRLFTVDEFLCMATAGILREDERVELLEGELFPMSPIGARHAACVNALNVYLPRLLGERALVAVRNPVQLSDRSMPQPDIAVLRPRADFCASRHPLPEDILWIVEVSDTSADYNRSLKPPLYANAGVPEVWLLDLINHQVELYRQPTPQGYRTFRRCASGDAISPDAFPDIRLAVDALLM